jgi:branched-chain amino acid transport system permease protein
MLQYALAGLVLGGIYAISAAGLVVTYVSTGVMNFAFAAIAFFVARLYYYLLIEQGWPLVLAAVVCILLVGPALGVVLYFGLLRHLSRTTQLIRVVATIGLAVAIPPIVALLFGQKPIVLSPGLAPQPVRVFHVAGVAITMDQLISYACVIVVLAVGAYVLRRTTVGLKIRAVVDSRAMTNLAGTNSARVDLGVWAASTFLAGLVGILAAPLLNVDNVNNYTLLVAAAFAAVVAARLRNLGVAVVAGLLMGILTSLVQWLLPPSSRWAIAALPSIPFAFIVVALAYYTLRGGAIGDDRASVGGALDRAIYARAARTTLGRRQAGASGHGAYGGQGSLAAVRHRLLSALRTFASSPGIVVLIVLPLILDNYRVGLVAQAAAYSIVFVSFTLITGEAGVISLCQITFAGVGALTTGQLATIYHWPLAAAIIVSALLAALLGVLVGALTLRMGDLYVALVTFTFGLLMSQLVFNQDRFVNGGLGVIVNRPGWLVSDTRFTYLTIAVFCVLAAVVVLIRSSTTGLALAAIRSSPAGARSIGTGVVGVKLLAYGVSAFIAAIAGAMLALYGGAALPDSYQALGGLVWIAVLVTMGARTVNAAALAGLSYVFVADIFRENLSPTWGQVPTLMFGFGAIMVAKNPEGVVAQTAGQLRGLVRLLTRSRRSKTDDDQSSAVRPADSAQLASAGVN